MAIFPEIVAGYEAAKDLLEGTGVRLRDPRIMPVFSDDPMTMFASFPPAYSVEAVPLREGINMVYNGRFGFADSRYEMLDYPTTCDDPDFKEKLKAVLMPKVEEFLAHAAKDKAQKHAENPDGIHESYEAIREIK